MSKPRKGAARLVAVIGATGAGKTEWIRQQLRRGKPKRLIVWDPKPTSNYAEFGQTFTSRAELVAAVKAAGTRGELRAIFRPGTDMGTFKEKFDWLCRLAFAWKHCTLVAEELAHVTKAGWSPPGWLQCVTLGREEGMVIFGATQRPALCDKTFISNASMIHCGRLQGTSDRKVMADLLDCNGQELVVLKPMEFIERADTGESRRGVVVWGAT